MPEFKWNIKEDGIDEVFDERGNSLLKLSETSWNDRPAKLELRKSTYPTNVHIFLLIAVSLPNL